MALPQPQQPGYTIEDWKAWPGRWEMIDGVAYDMAPAPSLAHQDISSNLHFSLTLAIKDAKKKTGGGHCKVFAAPTDVYLRLDAVVQPDLLVVCDPAKLSERGIEGAPDLVVEIISPSTAGKDWTVKRWLYESVGVPEYLIVDPLERVGVLLQLENGRYQEAARLGWGSLVKLLRGQIEIAVE